MSASPSLMNTVFIYAEDAHLALRQAASRGDMGKIKALFKNEEIADINSSGVESGRTALHQAAWQRRRETVKLLVSLGANPNLRDKKNKSAKELAEEKGDQAISLLLQQAEYGYNAIEMAKAAFPIPSNSCEDKAQALKDFISSAENIFHNTEKKIKKNLSNQGPLCASLVEGLMNIKASLQAAKDKNYRIGRCGELSKACSAFLLKNTTNVFVAKFLYYNKSEQRKNHSFVVLFPTEPKYMLDVNTWPEDTLICDAYAAQGTQLYFLNHAPEISAINEMQKVDSRESQLFSHKTIFDLISCVNPALYKDIDSLIQENYDLLCALQPLDPGISNSL